MIIITKLKQPKKFVEREMPNFESRRAKVMWLKNQKKLLALSTIKSVSVQIKDIKKMIYSDEPRLISLYAKFNLNKQSYNDEDYLTFTKRKNSNKSLIYSLISADWIINYNEIADKSDSDLEQECNELSNRISSLIEMKQNSPFKHKLEHKIKLYQYKLLCLSEYLDNRLENSCNIENSLVKRRNL